MRIRSLKPFVWQDEKLGRLSRDARLLFIGLITLADDEGRFRTLPSVICGHAYPYDTDAPRKLSKWLGELEAVGLITLYGDHLGYFPSWSRHQRISHRTPSIFPSPSRNGRELLPNKAGANPE